MKVTSDNPPTRRNALILIIGLLLLAAAAFFLLRTTPGDKVEPGVDTGAAAPDLAEQFPEVPPDPADLLRTYGPNDGPLEQGDIAYNFVLNDLDGNVVRLADFYGQPILVNFWATWCVPCRIEMPDLQTASLEYADDGLVVLGLNLDEPPDVVGEFFYDEMGLTFTPLIDQGQIVTQQYGVFNFPTSFFIDKDGTIAVIHRGHMAKSQIDGYMATLLAEQS